MIEYPVPSVPNLSCSVLMIVHSTGIIEKGVDFISPDKLEYIVNSSRGEEGMADTIQRLKTDVDLQQRFILFHHKLLFCMYSRTW